MKHQLTIEIKTLEIPEVESIPEKMSVVFETENMENMDKDEAIAKTLIACGQGWVEMKQDIQKRSFGGGAGIKFGL